MLPTTADIMIWKSIENTLKGFKISIKVYHSEEIHIFYSLIFLVFGSW